MIVDDWMRDIRQAKAPLDSATYSEVFFDIAISVRFAHKMYSLALFGDYSVIIIKRSYQCDYDIGGIALK